MKPEQAITISDHNVVVINMTRDDFKRQVLVDAALIKMLAIFPQPHDPEYKLGHRLNSTINAFTGSSADMREYVRPIGDRLYAAKAMADKGRLILKNGDYELVCYAIEAYEAWQRSRQPVP